MTAAVEAPAHLAELRGKLEELIARAADLAVAESRLEKVATELKTGELWTQGSPMIGAVVGAIEHTLFAALEDGSQTGLDIAQAGQDALDVLHLAISRVDDA